MGNLASRKASYLKALEPGTLDVRRLLSSASVVALVLSAGLALPNAVEAADWTGATSNDWFVTGNWNTGAVPTAGDVVTISTVTPNPTIVNGGNAVAQQLYLGVGSLTTGTLTILNGGSVSDTTGNIGNSSGSTGTVTVNGAGSTWTNSSNLAVGDTGTGTLTISNGGAVSNVAGTVGANAGSAGTVTVTGTGSTWSNSSQLVVGSNGTAKLDVLNGGAVSSNQGVLGFGSGSNATMTVDGTGSTWTNAGSVFVGAFGTASLTISNGGKVQNTLALVGGGNGSGTVNVAGTGSTWTNSGDLTVGALNSGTLTISNGGAVSNVDGIVGSGAGAVGTATITGAGSTWTNSGILIVGSFGSGTLNVLNGGAVSNVKGFVGSAAGSTGIVTIDGAGSTWANSSDLTIGSGGTGTLTISNGGTVSNVAGTVGAFAGSAGTATVTGAGSTWTNSGSLSVGDFGSGVLNILNGGAVSNANTGIVGLQAASVSVVTVDGAGSIWTNSSDLRIGNFGTGTLTISNGGVVSVGSLAMIAAQAGSTGTLNIGGAAGSAATAAGVLNAASVVFGSGTGTINFNHTDTNYIFASAISGLGTINQIAGNTNLTADSSGFTGATYVTGGRLAVNSSLGSSLVTVSGGGILGGNGIVGGIVANAGGIIGPGNSIGTLTVIGNITQAAGSTYQVELTSTGQSDRINASGTATIANGAMLNVVKLDAAPYVIGTHYTVLQAAGGVSGTYTLTGNTALSAFIGLVDRYDPTHVYLDVQQTKSFAAAGLTPNQRATGAGAESLGSGNPIYDAVIMLPTDAVAQYSFDQLSGEIHASAKGVMMEDSRFVREAAIDRLRAAFDAVGAVHSPVMSYAADDRLVPAPATTDRVALWAHGFGSFGRWSGDGNAAALRRDTGGFLTGADGLVGDTWRVGLLGGYSRTSFNVKDRSSSGTSDNYHVGLYGGTQWGNLAFRSGAAYTWHDLSTSRSVAFPGFADRLTGHYNAGTAQAFGEFGYGLKAGRFAFEPFANLAYVNLRTDGFTEKGGTAALTSLGSDANTTFSTLGLRGSTGVTLGGVVGTARATLGWRHAFGSVSPLSTFAFAGGSPFTIAGVPIARDAAVVDAGLDFNLSATAALGVSYGGQFAPGVLDQTVRANLNVKF